MRPPTLPRPGQQAKRELYRDFRPVVVGTSSTQLVGPNPRRIALYLSSPPFQANPETFQTALAQATSTASTGVKLSFTVPAGSQGTLTEAFVSAQTGTPGTVAIQIVRGGTTVTLASGTTALTVTGPIYLKAGDVVQINVTAAGTASAADMMISVEQDTGASQVTISFGVPATVGGGLNLGQGQVFASFFAEHIGQAIREEINAIASPVAQTIGILDVFEVDCPCGVSSTMG